MAGLFCCTGACGVVGLGTGNIQRHWAAVGTTAPTKETTTVPPGCSAAYRFAATSASSYLQAAVSDSRLSGGFWYRLASASAAVNALILPNASGQGLLQITSGLAARLQYGTGTAVNGPTIALNTWYWITWKSDSSGGTATITASIYDENGTLLGAEWSASATQATAVVTGVRIGSSGTVDVDAYAGGIYIDDDDATYPHARKNVVAMFPTADGAHSVGAGTFQTNTGAAITGATTTAWQSLPSTTIVGSTPHVRQTANATTAYLEFAFSGAPSGTADVVTATCNMLSQGAGAHTQKFAINDNANISDAVAASDFSQTTDSYCMKAYAVAPSSGAWSQAVLNAIKFRWGYGGSFPDNAVLGGLILEVATSAAAAAAGAIDPMGMSGFFGA